jgi:putative hemolysin
VFKIDLPVKPPVPNKLVTLVETAIGRLLALTKLEDIYCRVQTQAGTREFLDNVQKEFGVTCQVRPKDLERIPREGPTVVVANHPFGAIEGIILAFLMLSIRPDVKVMANYLLGRIPELKDIFLLVDPFENNRSVSNNLRPVRESMRWVEQGGLLAVFPSGEVSHLNLGNRAISDPEWSSVVARIIMKTKASVVPAFFRGANGPLFHLMGMVHPRLRTVMLPRELLKKTDKDIYLRLGGPIPAKTVKAYSDYRNMTEYLRWRTYLLKFAGSRKGLRPALRRTLKTKPEKLRPIAPAQRPGVLAQEVSALASEQGLVEAKDFLVFYASQKQIPNLIKEIGRMRELSFRQVGEGTGQPLDLDRFDEHYLHLVLWNWQKRELVGGYRLGLVDDILSRFGRSGLYTHSLFKFRKAFFGHILPAIEVGRSYVAPSYQRSYSPLMLLWKGIGAFVVKNPKYRYLFGPVSVSDNYQPLSRLLIMTYFETHHNSDLSRLVKPRNPARFPPSKELDNQHFIANLKDLEELSAIIADIEDPGQGIPILLKQYLKLESKAVGWNVDPDFGNALDCLMVTNLLASDARTMTRYQGKEGYESFKAFHADKQDLNLSHCA